MPIFISTYLEPKNNGSFFLLEDKHLRGGFRTVADVAARDVIPEMHLTEGALVYTAATNQYWRYVVATTSWAEVFTPAALNAVSSNAAITAATKTKITYDAKGLVTAGADLVAADIPNLDAAKITSGTLPIARGGTGATTAAAALTALGATTAGGNVVRLTNPSAISFLRFNADNTVSALNAADFRTAIGAGSGVGTVTSVGVSAGTTGLTATGGPITGSGTITLGGTLGVANGGTGATTLTGLVKGNGTSAFTAAVAGTDFVAPGGSITGNAATATALAAGRTIGMTGDVTWTSASFNGSANVTGTATLANSGVTAGTYGKVTVDIKGRVTAGTSLAAADIPALDWSKITTGKPTTLAGYGITDSAATAHAHGNITTAGAIGTTSGLPIITSTSGVLVAGSFGTAAGTFCQGNDARLSDARTPTTHTHTIANVTNLQTTLDGKVNSTNGVAAGLTLNDGYTEEVFAVSGTTPALSPTNGSIQTWTLTGNSTPTAGTWASGQSITLMVDDGSAATITWTSLAVVWKTNLGTAPTLQTTGYTTIALWKVGTVLYGARIGDA